MQLNKFGAGAPAWALYHVAMFRWLILLVFCNVAPAFTSEKVFYVRPEVLQQVSEEYGAEAERRVLDWQALVRRDLNDIALEDLVKLEHANTFFNQVRWISDIEHWGEDDYWAAPIETLASDGGDCEDFSIGKYFSLESAALPVEKLRITYVKAIELNQAHMVLAYYETPGAEPLILDNINKTVLPASQRADLLPIYSFDAKNIWLARDRGRKLKSDSKVNLPQWRRVNERLGFVSELQVENESGE